MMSGPNLMWPEDLRARLGNRRIIAVLMIDRVDDAIPVAESLVRGGVDMMELTLRTPAALDSLKAIRHRVPEMSAGVGTVLTPDQCRQAKDLGADFAVSPGFNRSVVASAIECGLPFGPGVATPSEIEGAWELGCNILKLFPAEPLGGLQYLSSMNAPYQHLGLSYIPLGGVNENNLSEWLVRPEIIAVGGSWIAPRDLVKEQNWGEIEKRARTARRIADRILEAGS
jgi:2-dehydro-3-deoxyphosphogluconate aldolase / (4S)-4-hydroxy-2-oxoglutarate aldolase